MTLLKVLAFLLFALAVVANAQHTAVVQVVQVPEPSAIPEFLLSIAGIFGYAISRARKQSSKQ